MNNLLKFVLIVLTGCSPVDLEKNREDANNENSREFIFTEADLRKSRESRIGQWIYPPDIVLCSDAPIRRQRLESAIRWWEDLGYRFGTLESDVRGGDCIRERPVGKIIVTLITQDLWDHDHYGKTVTTYHEPTGNIYYSKVYFFYSNTPTRVVRHELGHALGIGHYNRTGHIMHQSWSRGGLRTDGIEKK